ncbi:MAG: hypothetical protein M5T61_20920 [Acidimicrobiia bacterium]|nr:hypothetical protein [Acidimicrobiia bacterium]
MFVGTQRIIYTLRADVGGFYMHPTWYPAIRVYPLYRAQYDPAASWGKSGPPTALPATPGSHEGP